MLDEMGGGGLAVGAGNSHQGKLAGGKAVEGRRHLGQGPVDAAAGQNQNGLTASSSLSANFLPSLLGNKGRHGSSGERLADKLAAVNAGSRHAQEEIPSLHLARIGTQTPDLHAL
jgi:hypothetical protein